MLAAVLRWRVVAALLATLLAAGLRIYPDTGYYLTLILAVCAAVLVWRPLLVWLLLPPALVLLDFAPITGWYFLEEIDLFLLAGAAATYARLAAPSTPLPAMPLLARTGMAFMGFALLCGLMRALPLTLPDDLPAMNDYLSPYNALRSVKAWLWMGLYLPVLRRHLAQQPELLDRMLAAGLLGGLTIVVYCGLLERWQFPGLLNLASDYRISAPFSAMHTGGAALDGYLAMSLPLLALWLIWPQRESLRYLALGLLPLALYVALATFSRGLYMGLLLASMVLLAIVRSGKLVAVPSPYHAGRRPNSGRVLLALLLLLVQLQLSFRQAGYRAMLAAAAVLTLAALPAPRAAPRTLLPGLLSGLAMAALLALALPQPDTDWFIFKLPYLSLLVAGTLYYLTLAGGLAHAYLWLGLMQGAAIWISVHHAGLSVLPYACSLLPVCLLWQWLLRSDTPAPSRQCMPLVPAVWTLVAMLLVATAVPFYNGYFVGERFARAESDFYGRWQHWEDVLALLAMPYHGYWLGAGAGSFPARYYWFNTSGETPAHASFPATAGRRYLHLQAGSYAQGYGELLRVLQVVKLQPQTAYRLSLELAGGAVPAFLQVQICARRLLYPANCVSLPQQSVAAHAGWKRLSFTLNSAVLDSALMPLKLELAAEGNGATLDVDNISLIDLATGKEHLRNGDFSARDQHWFFSSDHHHLPWHIKNLLLNLYFEYGVAGLLGYLLMLASAVASLLARCRQGDRRTSALVWLASIVAFETVGLFDSLIDVPRILLLHLLVLSAVLLSHSVRQKDSHV